MCNDAIRIALREKPSGRFRLIELAFEQGNGGCTVDYGGDEEDLERRAAEWRPEVRGAENRMRAIMQNIVKNDGEFVP